MSKHGLDIKTRTSTVYICDTERNLGCTKKKLKKRLSVAFYQIFLEKKTFILANMGGVHGTYIIQYRTGTYSTQFTILVHNS